MQLFNKTAPHLRHCIPSSDAGIFDITNPPTLSLKRLSVQTHQIR